MKHFSILTYNIHKGFDIGNRNMVLDQIKKSLHHTDAEIVFLQEVSGHNQKETHHIPEWQGREQFEYLADQRWNHYAYGKNAAYTDGHHGNALLSKFPIAEWSNINLSTNRFEKRGCIHAKISFPDTHKTLHAFCLHLNLLEGGRAIQIEQMVRYIQENNLINEPIILAGDFNDWRKKITPLLKDQLGMDEAFINRHGEHPKTFPSFSPFLPLDRIYFKNLKLVEASLIREIEWDKLSDHVGLHATFGL